MATGYVLTEADRRLIQEAIRQQMRDVRNTTGRAGIEIERDPVSPEFHLARTPLTGIPEMAEVDADAVDTGTSVPGDYAAVPASAECDVYRLDDPQSREPHLIPVPGLVRRVFNPFGSWIAGRKWVPVARDKHGAWWATSPVGAGEDYGTGTGTGTDDGGDAGGPTIVGNGCISVTTNEAGETVISSTVVSFSGARVYRDAGATQSDPSDFIEFNARRFDTDGYWSTANPERFTAPEDGFYLVGWSIKPHTAAAVAILYSGTNVPRQSTAGTYNCGTHPFWLSKGEYVQFLTYGACTLSASDGSTCEAWILRLDHRSVSSFGSARVYRATDQEVDQTISVPIELSTEEWDDGDYWDSAAPTRFTIPADGVYLLGGHLTNIGVGLRVNGTTFIVRGVDFHTPVINVVDIDLGPNNACTLWKFEKGDYVELISIGESVTPGTQTSEAHTGLSPVMWIARVSDCSCCDDNKGYSAFYLEPDGTQYATLETGEIWHAFGFGEIIRSTPDVEQTPGVISVPNPDSTYQYWLVGIGSASDVFSGFGNTGHTARVKSSGGGSPFLQINNSPGSSALTVHGVTLTRDNVGGNLWEPEIIWSEDEAPPEDYLFKTPFDGPHCFFWATRLDGGIIESAAPDSSGTVTSVALTMPVEFSVAGSPITTAGTLAVSKVSQSANVVYAGPVSGGAAAPAFRALVEDDLPTHVHDASVVTYTPLVATDWDGDADPGNVDDALDQLAERVDDLEGAGGSGHVIRENGTNQTARAALNFVDTGAGAGLITDDAGNNETEVNLNLYALLAGRSGGQTLKGGTADGDQLTLESTSNATKRGIRLVSQEYFLFNTKGSVPTGVPAAHAGLYFDGNYLAYKRSDNSEQFVDRLRIFSTSSDLTAEDGRLYTYSISSATSYTLTLPASPTHNMRVGAIIKEANNQTVTIARNGNTIDGAAADVVLIANGDYVELMWQGGMPTTWLTVARKFNPQTGESVLGSTYTINATSTYQNTGLSVSLPCAGTYDLDGIIRGTVWADSFAYLAYRLYDATAGAAVTNSEGFIVQSSGVQFQASAALAKRVVVTRASTIRLEARRETSGSTWTNSDITSDANGRTTMRYTRSA